MLLEEAVPSPAVVAELVVVLRLETENIIISENSQTTNKHLLFKEGLVTAFFLDFFSFFPLPEAAHERKCTIKNTDMNLTDKLTASRRRG